MVIAEGTGGGGLPDDLLAKIAAENRLAIRIESGLTTYWGGLSENERYILNRGGWVEPIYNDFITPSLSKVDPIHDPVVWVATLFSLGKLTPSLIRFISTFEVGGAVQSATTGTSLWPAPWHDEGRQVINDTNYSIHAIERMLPVGFGGRGIPPPDLLIFVIIHLI